MSWGEFVHVIAEYFEPGEYPWTEESFYSNSVLQADAPHTIDPIVLTIFDSEGPRVAENDGWWEHEGVWWGKQPYSMTSEYLPLDDELRLNTPAVRFRFAPLTTKAGDKGKPPEGLILYQCRMDGDEYTFQNYLDEIKALCDKYRKGRSYVSLLTLWSCDAGWQYIPGEPDEYDANWQLIGAVLPKAGGVTYEEIA